MTGQRRYCFNNQYMCGLRSGIQGGHAAEEMWVAVVRAFLDNKSERTKNALEQLMSFASDHKTWIVLDGHDHDALTDLFQFLSRDQNPYPYAKFHEPGLNNALTSVTIILPERMYDDLANAVSRALLAETDAKKWTELLTAEDLKSAIERNYTPWECEFLKRKAVCKLAD